MITTDPSKKSVSIETQLAIVNKVAATKEILDATFTPSVIGFARGNYIAFIKYTVGVDATVKVLFVAADGITTNQASVAIPTAIDRVKVTFGASAVKLVCDTGFNPNVLIGSHD